MAVLNKCCCCCQLRTGVVILGWVGMVWALFDIAGSSIVYANRNHFFPKMDPELRHELIFPQGDISMSSTGHNCEESLHSDCFLQILHTSELSLYLPIYITYAVVSLLTNILMAWGASQSNRFFLLPWLVTQMISLIVVGVVVLTGGTFFLVVQSKVRYVGALILCVGIPIFVIQLYIWLCVLSCFQELRDSSGFEPSVSLMDFVGEYQPPGYQRVDSI